LAAALLAASCGSGGPKLYPVSGKVFYLDKPAEGATVVLVPAGGSDNGLRPTGPVEADGSFTLSTHPHGDGAPEGDYLVAVTWYPPNAREMDSPRSKLPARYGDAAQSGLKVTVKPESNELEPFRLTK
jgi:hypothetical protein